MRLTGFGIVEGEPIVMIDSIPPLPMPLPPQPPGEGYGYVSCLDHPEVENCYWPSGSVPPTGAVQGPVPLPIASITPPSTPPSVFGDLTSLPRMLLVGGLIFFLFVATGRGPTRGKTVRSLVA